MFDSLDDTIKHDREMETTKKERWLWPLVAAVISILVFGGIYMGVRLLE